MRHKSTKAMGIPDRWLKYTASSIVIPGTRFIAFKVPLKETICKHLSKEKIFTPEKLLRSNPNLGMVVDLTYTTRYYDREVEFINKGVQHEKIFCPGQVIPPDNLFQLFTNLVDDFIGRSTTDKLIGVHCTHGLNRTGYFICRYMSEKLDMDPDVAIGVFEEARGHKMERDNYKKAIREFYEKSKRGNPFPVSNYSSAGLSSHPRRVSRFDVPPSGYESQRYAPWSNVAPVSNIEPRVYIPRFDVPPPVLNFPRESENHIPRFDVPSSLSAPQGGNTEPQNYIPPAPLLPTPRIEPLKEPSSSHTRPWNRKENDRREPYPNKVDRKKYSTYRRPEDSVRNYSTYRNYSNDKSCKDARFEGKSNWRSDRSRVEKEPIRNEASNWRIDNRDDRNARYGGSRNWRTEKDFNQSARESYRHEGSNSRTVRRPRSDSDRNELDLEAVLKEAKDMQQTVRSDNGRDKFDVDEVPKEPEVLQQAPTPVIKPVRYFFAGASNVTKNISYEEDLAACSMKRTTPNETMLADTSSADSYQRLIPTKPVRADRFAYENWTIETESNIKDIVILE